MFRPKATFLFFLVVAILLSSYSVFAQSSPSTIPQPASASQDTQLLHALLEEVRQLRLAVEKNGLRQHQAQVVWKCIEKQQDRVTNVSLELEQLRTKIQHLSNPGRYDEAIKEAETAIREAADPQARAHLTQAYEDLKRSLERQKRSDQQELEQQRERERQLDAQLHTEQDKLAELQGRMEALEQDFVAQRGEPKKDSRPR